MESEQAERVNEHEERIQNLERTVSKLLDLLQLTTTEVKPEGQPSVFRRIKNQILFPVNQRS